MKINQNFLKNIPVDFVYFKIDSSDDLTQPKKIVVNPTISPDGDKTVGYPIGEGFNSIWFKIETTVSGVTGNYDPNTGEIIVTKNTDWAVDDSVAILYSIFTLREA